ncbi:MAG: hypothetical protein QM541_08310 [Flavobacterium sp.]|nr:hypothetical protein [Flavobacterium sp.]
MAKHQLNIRVSNYVSLVFLFAFTLLQNSCNAQIEKKPKLSPSNYKPKFENEKSLGNNIFNVSYQMKIYADSLNSLKNSDNLPSFVFNACFDNQPVYWTNLHTAISLRKMVLDSVTNKIALERLSNDNRLTDVCKSCKDIKIPLLEKSFSELSKERLKEL